MTEAEIKDKMCDLTCEIADIQKSINGLYARKKVCEQEIENLREARIELARNRREGRSCQD